MKQQFRECMDNQKCFKFKLASVEKKGDFKQVYKDLIKDLKIKQVEVSLSWTKIFDEHSHFSKKQDSLYIFDNKGSFQIKKIKTLISRHSFAP